MRENDSLGIFFGQLENTEYESLITEACDLVSSFVEDHFDLCATLIKEEAQNNYPFNSWLIWQLYLSCSMSIESSLILVRAHKEFDSEIINRSILEGLTKFVYISIHKNEEQDQLVDEYWTLLSDFAAVKRSDRAQRVLDLIGEESSLKWRALEDFILSSTEVEKFRHNMNKQERRAVEQKWGFVEILEALKRKDDTIFKSLGGLLYQYGMSSHLIHKDSDGIGMVWDRTMRKPVENRMLLKTSHLMRILVDLCTFCEVKTKVFFHSSDIDITSVIDELHNKYSRIFELQMMASTQFTNNEYVSNG